jgi:hypothetical protein
MIAAASLWIVPSAGPAEATVVYVTYTGTPAFGAPPLALAKALLLPLPDGVLCGSTLPFSSLGRS